MFRPTCCSTCSLSKSEMFQVPPTSSKDDTGSPSNVNMHSPREAGKPGKRLVSLDAFRG
jgi:hypothetical protein